MPLTIVSGPTDTEGLRIGVDSRYERTCWEAKGLGGAWRDWHDRMANFPIGHRLGTVEGLSLLVGDSSYPGHEHFNLAVVPAGRETDATTVLREDRGVGRFRWDAAEAELAELVAACPGELRVYDVCDPEDPNRRTPGYRGDGQGNVRLVWCPWEGSEDYDPSPLFRHVPVLENLLTLRPRTETDAAWKYKEHLWASQGNADRATPSEGM